LVAMVGAALGAVAVAIIVASPRGTTTLLAERAFEEVPGPVNYVRKTAFAVPLSVARTQQLVSTDGDGAQASDATPPNAAEEARCVGLLHACQTWLELKDGEKNSIVITSPTDETKELVNHDIVLPKSGAAIPSKTWGVMQESCKYGLSDLASCDKPARWPKCTGAECSTDAAKEREDARAKEDEDETTLVQDGTGQEHK